MNFRWFASALFLATAVLATSAPCAAQTRTASPRVLVIHSYAPDFSWTRDLHAGIVSVLQSSKMWADYRVEYMDAKHYTSPAYQQRFLELLRDKYTGARFDGVILTDNHALDLVARHREKLFPRTPIVVCGINDPKSIPDNAGDMNIIIESAAHRETLEVALRQNPNTRKIFVLIDNTLTGQSILRDFQDQARFLPNSVEIEVLPPLAQDDLIRFARERSPGELIYLLVYFEDAVGKVFQAEEIPRAVATNAPVPIYVAWDFQTDLGTVGGCVTSAFGHGQKAAQTLLERLAGKKTPHVYSGLRGVSQHVYDYTALQRFGIPLSTLPDNALILHRPMSYFEIHRSAILVATGIIAIMSVIMLLLIQNVVRQRKINRSNTEILTLNREIIETQQEVLSTLGEVIETRSHETANHVRRVAAYAALIGKKCGLDREELTLLEAAAPMHDVGKIGIPESVLHKPERLSVEEFEIIKHHTVIGFRILHSSGRKLMAAARLIALQHHERWDGTGYPCGLKGEEISLQARIITLADVYDALSHDRVYKQAWPRDKVLAFIRRERGGLFDPRLVDLFFENIEELEAIKRRLSDPTIPPDELGVFGPVTCPTRQS